MKQPFAPTTTERPLSRPAWLVPNLICNTLSLVSCVWLVYRIVRLPQVTRQRLFPRQLLSLALACLLMNFSFVPVVVVDFSFVSGEHVCGPFYISLRTFRFIAVMQEMCIALGFFLQSVKWFSPLPILNLWTPGNWLVGLLLGTISATNHWEYNHGQSQCRFILRDETSVIVVFACVTCSTIATIATMVKSLSLPRSVAKRAFKRAVWYPAVTICTYTLPMVAYVRPELFTEPQWYWPLALLLELSNGFLNAAMFGIQSTAALRGRMSDVDDSQRLSRTSNRVSLRRQSTATSQQTEGERRRSVARELVTFEVNFGGVEVIDILDTSITEEQEQDMVPMEIEASYRTDASPPRAINRHSSDGSAQSAGSSASSRPFRRVKAAVVGRWEPPGMECTYLVEVVGSHGARTLCRSYGDFVALRAKLEQRLPAGTELPKLPPETCPGQTYWDCGLTARRQRGLDQFLAGCVALETDDTGPIRDLRYFLDKFSR